VAAGHPDRLVKRRAPGAAEGLMVGGLGVRLDASSVVGDSELFVALDAAEAADAKGRFVRVRAASAVRREWLEGLFPGAVRSEDAAAFDEVAERVVGRRVTRFHDLVLDERETGSVDEEDAARLLFEAASRRLDRAVDRTRDIQDVFARVAWLRRLRPELPETALLLLEALRALCRGRRSFAELRKAPLLDFLLGALTAGAWRDLDALAPARLRLSSGRSLRLDYALGGAPVLAARLQEFFGLERTPAVAGGHVPVVLHLLAPNRRPVQVTTDLASFWRNVYPKVRNELRRRYPRHAWPEDPLAASPEARPARRRD
jgi:ATP-dependent helicase HrpB